MIEPLEGLFNNSRLMILDFAHIAAGTPREADIRAFFDECNKLGIDPREPKSRQAFNDRMLDSTGARYLVSQYGEDRSAMLAGSAIAEEGRVLHLGIDVFAKDLEIVYAPCDGEIIRVDREPQNHSFGNFLLLRPAQEGMPIFFFGHLAADGMKIGQIKAGEPIAKLGDFKNMENGGWSRHLHIQMLKDEPLKEIVPPGYSTQEDFVSNQQDYPNPLTFFPDWVIKS